MLTYILLLLLASASAIARTWHRNIAIANAAGPTGLAALCFLRDAKREDKSCADLNVCAIVRSEEEAVQCRQAVCGALACGGTVRDQCLYSFPTLTTSTALSSMYNGNVVDRLVEALNGCTTLVILLDEIHPTLDASTQENAMVRVPPVVSAETTRCLDEGLRLIDAAAAASSVQHVILQSALGASDSSFSMLQTARMGGSEHLSLRRKLEEHLESYSQRGVVTPTAPLRHTILQAAPYASPLQIAERRDADAGEADALVAAPPLTSPEALAHSAVEAALYTRPNTLARRVTRRVVCAGESS